MSDIMPNPDLRRKRLQVRINELKLNIERMELRKLELADELSKIDENVVLTNKAIAESQKELGG
jgi:hypothetical protein